MFYTKKFSAFFDYKIENWKFAYCLFFMIDATE